MDRLISEQYLIEHLKACFENGRPMYRPTLDEVLEMIKSIPSVDKREYHIDHTDCIWYGSDSGCPVTCSQYRDGWNDAMDYIFKNGKGYQPYTRKRG